jgi:hypothetical protein
MCAGGRMSNGICSLDNGHKGPVYHFTSNSLFNISYQTEISVNCSILMIIMLLFIFVLCSMHLSQQSYKIEPLPQVGGRGKCAMPNREVNYFFLLKKT